MPRLTARGGVLAWLRACAEEARERGVECVVRNSTLHTKGKAWLLAHGYASYSASNLERRFREVREWGLAADTGLTITPVRPGDPAHTPGAEQSWTVRLSNTPPPPTDPTRSHRRIVRPGSFRSPETAKPPASPSSPPAAPRVLDPFAATASGSSTGPTPS